MKRNKSKKYKKHAKRLRLVNNSLTPSKITKLSRTNKRTANKRARGGTNLTDTLRKFLKEDGCMMVFHFNDKEYTKWFNNGSNDTNLLRFFESGGLQSIIKNVGNLDKLNFYPKNDSDNNFNSADKLLNINKALIDQITIPPYNNGFKIISTEWGKVVEYHIEIIENID